MIPEMPTVRILSNVKLALSTAHASHSQSMPNITNPIIAEGFTIYKITKNSAIIAAVPFQTLNFIGA